MTEPHPRTVESVSAPVEHYIIAVPPAQDGVCAVCHGATYDGWTTCWACNDAKRRLGTQVLDAVAFISLAPVGEQMARDLYTYKLDNVPPQQRQERTLRLSATLWRWLSKHEKCLAQAVGLPSGQFDIITTVPSTSGRTAQHPLVPLVSGIVIGSEKRYGEVLQLNRANIRVREAAVDRFASKLDLRSKSILVIDDTWTTGAKMQSASAALKKAGASKVAGIAIGRWFTSEYRENATWLREKRKAKWTWDVCCLEDRRPKPR